MFDKYENLLSSVATESSTPQPAQDSKSERAKKKKLHKKAKVKKHKIPKWPPLEEIPIFSFDSEYQFNPVTNSNEVLCYTFDISLRGDNFSGFISVDNNERLHWDEFVVRSVEAAIDAGVLPTYPTHMYMAAHYTKADVFNFKDAFENVGVHLSGMRKTVVSLEHSYGVDLEAVMRQRIDKEPIKIRTRSRNSKHIFIRFYDTMLLSPNGKSLADIGELVGLPKLEIPEPFSIERMREYKEKDPQGFKEYALRDAVIARRFMEKMIAFCVDNGIGKLPLTVGSMAVTLFKKSLPDDVDINSLFGYRIKSKEVWNPEKGNVLTFKRRQPMLERLLLEQFAILSYHGGRNEAFWMGLTPKGAYYDLDIPSCYTASMIGIREIDYSSSRETRNVHELLGDKCAFALVDFSFPEGTRYPCLPVRMDSGLMYPLSGESFCTGHELEVALNMGVELHSVRGFVFPWKDDTRIFEHFVSHVRNERNKYPKGSFEERLWKEIGNSLYGKLAQGLRGKNAFDVESGLSKSLPYTSLTNPYFAAYTTGLARAVLSEMLVTIPENYDVISVTTDGFLTNSPLESVSLNGPLCQRFNSHYSRICESEEQGKLLELKHAANQLICMKTRGQLTVEPMVGYAPVLAKAGIRPPRDCRDHNQYMVDLYRKRTPECTIDASHLTPLRSMYLERRDMVTEEKSQRLNMEFDFKRLPVNALMFDAGGWEHIGSPTKPFYTLEEFDFTRAVFKGFRENHCLKTVNDLELFEDFYAMRRASRSKAINIQYGETSDELLIRIFLRFYTNSLLGLDASELNATQLSLWLSEHGYKVTPEKVRSAKRSKLVEGAVPRTARSIRCEKLLALRFPSADLNCLFES
ncbi:TPA: hypothetical protein NGT30_002513 [Vibrio parahaemolyticus]|nr:hypothetical protein [Vibrio parahaemolyticus]HCE4677508.1 hypothetical protein [Vibrio parahaemolyticus]